MMSDREHPPIQDAWPLTGKLILLTEPAAVAELESFGELPALLWQRHSGRLTDCDPAHFQSAIVALPESLLFWGVSSEAGAGEDRDLWRRLLHCLTRRLLVRLVFVREADHLDPLLHDWHDRFRGGVLPELQIDLQPACLQVLVVIFLREVRPEDAAVLNALSRADPDEPDTSGSSGKAQFPRVLRAYVMGPRLRIGMSGEAPLVDSRHVWPLALTRLLLRLLSWPPAAQERPGLWAWRCLDGSPDIDQPAFDLATHRMWQQVTDTFLRGSDRDPADSQPVSPIGELPSLRLAQPPGSREQDERMGQFIGLRGQGECEAHVRRETEDQAWMELLNQAGAHYHGERNQRDRRFLAQFAEHLKHHWRKVAHRPEWLAAPIDRSFAWAREMEVAAKLKQQEQRWDHLLASGHDFFARKEKLRACARELDRTRRGFVGFTGRLVFALIAGLLLAFSATAVLRVWMTAWQNAPDAPNEVTRFLLYLAVVLAVGVGCAGGALLPYWIERRQGKRGGRYLQTQLALLRHGLHEQIQARFDLCAAGDSLRLATWGLAAAEFQRRLTTRARELLERLLLSTPAEPAAANPATADPDPAHPTPSPLVKAMDRRHYRRGTTLELGRWRNLNLVDLAARQLATLGPELQQQLLEVYATCCAADCECRGWLPWSVFHRHLGSQAARIRDQLKTSLVQALADAPHQALSSADFSTQLRQRFGATTHDWPFLSVPALPARNSVGHPVFVATRPGVDARLIENELRRSYQADVVPLAAEPRNSWLWQLPIFAFVFEELKVDLRIRNGQPLFFEVERE